MTISGLVDAAVILQSVERCDEAISVNICDLRCRRTDHTDTINREYTLG